MLEVHKLRVVLGETGLTAWGDLDLGTRAGRSRSASCACVPRTSTPCARGPPAREVAPLLSGDVTGKGELRSDGKKATLRLSLDAGGGKVELQATSTLGGKPSGR